MFDFLKLFVKKWACILSRFHQNRYLRIFVEPCIFLIRAHHCHRSYFQLNPCYWRRIMNFFRQKPRFFPVLGSLLFFAAICLWATDEIWWIWARPPIGVVSHDIVYHHSNMWSGPQPSYLIAFQHNLYPPVDQPHFLMGFAYDFSKCLVWPL